MTNVLMSAQMEAFLRKETDNAFEKARFLFHQSLSRSQMPQPMATLNDSTTFRIQTTADGTREFTFTVSLQELGTTSTTPTSGYDQHG